MITRIEVEDNYYFYNPNPVHPHLLLAGRLEALGGGYGEPLLDLQSEGRLVLSVRATTPMLGRDVGLG